MDFLKNPVARTDNFDPMGSDWQQLQTTDLIMIGKTGVFKSK
jgi:hypothetical protein